MAELIQCTSKYKSSPRDKKFQVTERCVLRCNSVGIFTAVPSYMEKYDAFLDEHVKFQMMQAGDVLLEHTHLVLNEKISNITTTWKYATTIPGVYIEFKPTTEFLETVIAKNLWSDEGFVWENIPESDMQIHFVTTWTPAVLHDTCIHHAVGMIKDMGSSFNVTGSRVLPAQVTTVRNLYKTTVQDYIKHLTQEARDQVNMGIFIVEDGKVMEYNRDTFLNLTDIETGVKEIVMLRRFGFEGNGFIQSIVVKVEAKR